MTEIKIDPRLANIYLEVDRYNEEAAKIEAILKENCPLIIWSVRRSNKEDYKTDPFALDIFNIKGEVIVNSYLFTVSVSLERKAQRLINSPFSMIVSDVAYKLTDQIIKFQPR